MVFSSSSSCWSSGPPGCLANASARSECACVRTHAHGYCVGLITPAILAGAVSSQ
jgi:hypothetical protein